MIDLKVHELAVEILRQHTLMTMKEAVELAQQIIRDQEHDQEKPCNLPRSNHGHR